MSKIILNIPDNIHNVSVVIDGSSILSPGYSISWQDDFKLLPGDLVSVNVFHNNDQRD